MEPVADPAEPSPRAPLRIAQAEKIPAASPALRHNHLLRLSADQLHFTNVKPNVIYTRRVEVTNPLPAPVEVTVRTGAPDRYSVEPSTLALGPHATSTVEVRCRLTSLPAPRRAGGAGGAGGGSSYKDTFTLKSSFGVQRFFAILTPSDGSNPVESSPCVGAPPAGVGDGGGSAAARCAACATACAGGGAALVGESASAEAWAERAAIEQALQQTIAVQAQQLTDQAALLALSEQRTADEVAHATASACDLAAAALATAASRRGEAGGVGAMTNPLDPEGEHFPRAPAGGDGDDGDGDDGDGDDGDGGDGDDGDGGRRASVLDQLHVLESANASLQHEVAATAAELAASQQSLHSLNATHHDLLSRGDAPAEVCRVIERMHAEDETKSARVLAVLHAKDAEIGGLCEENDALRAQLDACEARLAEAQAKGALGAQQAEGLLRERSETASALVQANEQIVALHKQVENWVASNPRGAPRSSLPPHM